MMNSTPKEKHVVVVGAGISGLAAAFRLNELSIPGLKITVLEASDKAGGVISTLQEGNLLLELGPDSFITKPAALSLAKRLCISEEIIATKTANRRTFVAWQKKLHPLPEGFIMLAPTNWQTFLLSSLFSWSGKLRMAMEMFIPNTKAGQDESLADFVRRRFGEECLERVAQPMIGGVYTADPEKLSLKATMPRFLDLEQKYKSVIWGLLNESGQNKHAGARYSLFVSLKKGMQFLVDSIIAKLPKETLRLNTAITSISKTSRGYLLEVSNQSTALEADAVILAVSAKKASQLTKDIHPSLADELAKIDYAPSAVLNLVYNKSDINKPFKGFGFVVPFKEGASIIALSVPNNKFDYRCPSNTLLIRIFMGGALQSEILGLSDKEIISRARQDLKTYLEIDAQPQLTRLTRYPASMPQYHIGHTTLISNIYELLSENANLMLAGNYLAGPGIPDCISTAERAAESIAYMFQSKSKIESSIG